MRHAFVTFCICALLLTPAHADQPAATFTGGIFGGFQYGGSGTLGFNFSTAKPVRVTALGIYDVGYDGLAASHDVGLWDSNGVLLATVNVPSGVAAPFQDGFRYVFLSEPLSLAANENYVVGAFFSQSDQAASDVTDFSFHASLNYRGNASTFGSSSLTRPSPGSSFYDAGYFGPGFLLASDPGSFPVLRPSDPCGSGPKRVARRLHSATLLNNGKVLLAGGEVPYYVSEPSPSDLSGTAELVDPTTGEFALLAATMMLPRTQHTAVLLTNGNVLITGGYSVSGNYSGASANYTAAAELFDANVASFVPLPGMSAGRLGHAATLLPDGKVLLSGGRDASVVHDSAELFNPETKQFTPIAQRMNSRRFQHTATLLANGRVLLAGGTAQAGYVATASAEIYDPATQTFASVLPMNVPRVYATATLLPTGEVLLVGGVREAASAEIYNPASQTFALTVKQPTYARSVHTATPLPDGNVLLAGGLGATGVSEVSKSAELYDSQTGQFLVVEPMFSARPVFSSPQGMTSVRLPTGKVYFDGPGNSDEVYDPATKSFVLLSRAAVCSVAVENGALTLRGGSLAYHDIEIQAASNPDGEFVPVATLPATVNEQFVWSEPAPRAADRGFYRVLPR